MCSSLKVCAIVSLLCAATVAQADGIRDAGSKIRGDYDTVTRSRRFYAAPQMVYQAPIAAAAAPAPAERRSFSVEPGTQQAAPSMVQRPSRVTRQFSYQPNQAYNRGSRNLYDSNADSIRDAGSKIRASY